MKATLPFSIFDFLFASNSNHKMLAIWTSLLLVSCQGHETATTEKTSPTLKGVWELTDKYAYENNAITDSVKVTSEERLVKIFTAQKYMWSRVPSDTLDWHAYGTYEYDEKTLVEHKEFTSRSMATHSASAICNVVMGNNSYTQIFIDSAGAPFYAEKYKRIE